MYPRSLPIALASLILVLAGGILWFVLTRPTSEGPAGSATSTPQSTAEKVHIEDSGEYHQIDGYYPSETPLKASAGARADASAVFVMKTFVTKEVARFEDNNVAELSAEDIAIQNLGGERKYILEVDYDFHESPDTLSYVYHMYADTLGAHGNAYYRTFTFDKQSGEELHIQDLFISDAYLEVLSQQSRAALYETLGDNASPDMLEAGTTPYSDNFQNFYLEGDALVLVFPPYQVGPWAIGTQEARIPREDLQTLLAPQYR